MLNTVSVGYLISTGRNKDRSSEGGNFRRALNFPCRVNLSCTVTVRMADGYHGFRHVGRRFGRWKRLWSLPR